MAKEINVDGTLEFKPIWFGLGEMAVLNKGTRKIGEKFEIPDVEFIGLAINDKWMWSKWDGFEKLEQDEPQITIISRIKSLFKKTK